MSGEDEIIKIFDKIEPSKELIQRTKFLVRRRLYVSAAKRLALQIASSAAALLLLVFGLSMIETSGDTPLGEFTASVFSGASPYLLAGGLFAAACVLFVVLFFKKIRKK